VTGQSSGSGKFQPSRWLPHAAGVGRWIARPRGRRRRAFAAQTWRNDRERCSS